MPAPKRIIQAVSVDCDTITATCPTCSTKHIYKETGFNVYNMNGYTTSKQHFEKVEDDQFVLQLGPPDTLWPPFVCRNIKCDYEGKVQVK